ncbi:DUF5674 family protein [Candidatus Gracilibacteria bacterium]|nr:DUF5674 family protein [Candidatus Gracilibacteria bacterium]
MPFVTKIIREPIKFEEIETLAKKQFGDFVKAVVDIENVIIAIGGELHADQESLLLDKGSQQEHLRGINIYPQHFGQDSFIEFDSMINIRPRLNNRTRGIQDINIQKKIRKIVNLFIVP